MIDNQKASTGDFFLDVERGKRRKNPLGFIFRKGAWDKSIGSINLPFCHFKK
jgi:hypothetical protein